MALEGFFGFSRKLARPTDTADNRKAAYLGATWGERVVTTIAVVAAVAVVASIAVLMGSVGP